MTSGVFGSCLIDQITVGERQRSTVGDLTDLKASLAARGQIHPIVVTRDFVLVAGFRRLTSAKDLGWTNISYQFVDELDPEELELIELEENIKRENLSWVDEARAVERIHMIRKEKAESNIEYWNEEDTANVIGMSQTYVSNQLSTVEALNWKPELVGASAQSKVLTAYRNAKSRGADSPQYGGIIQPEYNNHILHCSFLDWARTYDGPRFNLIHCDFPFGIGYSQFGSQAGLSTERYQDDIVTYDALLATISAALDLIVEESAHIIFWFSMRVYERTYTYLLNLGFDVDPFPLIWIKSDNVGILPDPSRGPRRIYETAFLGRCGDRRIVRPKANAIAAPTTKLIHPHEKPDAVLEHFFEMLVDENTSLFDPTCGGGGALRAARRLGAPRVLGLEIDAEYARQANIELNKLEEELA